MSNAYLNEGNNLKSEIQDKAVDISTKLSGEFFSNQSMTKEQFAEALGQARQDSLKATSEIASNYAEKARLEGDLRKSSFYTNMANAYSDLASNYQTESASEYLARTDALVAKGLSELTGVAGDLYTSMEAYDKYLEGDIDGASAVLVGMLAGTAAWALAITVASGPIGIGIALIASVVVGDMFKEIFPGWESIFDYWLGDDISSDVNVDFLSALNFVQRSDPLALDLDGDGIETVSANTGITFDFNGDGLKTGTGWVKGDDGLLVLDRNGNGAIDNGGELFGVDTVKSNGQKATDGFDALRDLDSNGDGVFNAEDAEFSKVRVWQDANQDGVAQAGELKTLAQHDITAINLDSTATDQASNGNVISAVGSFVRGDGTSGAINGNQSLAANLDLASNPFYREYTDKQEPTTETAALPDMRGSGAVRDLREAAAQNVDLRAALASYSQAQTREEQIAKLDGLLAAWANSSGYDTLFERIDDMKLGFTPVKFAYSWEQGGAPLTGGSNGGTGSGTGGIEMGGDISFAPPEPTAAQLEKKALLEKVSILEVFNGQNFFNFVSQEGWKPNGELSHELVLASGANRTTKRPSSGGGSMPMLIVITEEDLVINAGQAALLNASYEKLKESIYNGLLLQTRLKPYADSIELVVTEAGLAYNFTGLLDQVNKEVDPVNSIINLLEFSTTNVGGMVPVAELSNLVDGLRKKLTLEDVSSLEAAFGSTPTSRADILVGSTIQGLSGDDVLFATGFQAASLSGGAGDDLLFGGANGDFLYGNEGDDILLGGDGNDTLDGGAGSNQLFGEGGDDILKVAVSSKNNVLSGGAGNDTLTGGYYNDTYLFNLGDGRDTIYDHDGGYASTDVLRFGEGIASADIQTLKSGTDLVFRHVNGADQITVKNWFSGTTAAAGVAANNIIERVEFADGTAWSWSDIAANGLTQSGGSGNDIVIGWAGNDIMYGGDGNDTLDGGAGSNQLFGEGGDDILKVAVSSKNNVLSGGAGNDTLTGGYYNDTYLFNLGDGRDTIYDHDGGYASTDVLRFGEGIASADIQTLKSGTDLVFRHVNGADQITVKNWFSGTTAAAGVAANNIIERVEFADGTAWSWSDIAANGLTQSGGSGNDIVIGWAGNDIMYGGDGNDTLDGGAGSNQLFGEGGDDILKVAVSSKNNVLSGGAGNDTLTGGYYNDTYLFNLGDGRDTIYDHDGGYASTDVLRFGEGIASADIQTLKSGTDLVFRHVNGADQITVKNWFSGTTAAAGVAANNIIERVEFADGTAWSWSDIAANGLTQSGGSGNDIVIGWAGNDIMYGGDGNDTLDGGAGSNQLFGEGGDDILKVAVSSKNNVLSGGAGNDTLTGGYYNDTYLFNLGDGRDTIYDHDGGYASTDVLRFGEGIASADIQTLKSGTDLVFRHVNGADQITVKNWFSGTTAAAGVAANNIIERVEFADGTAWSWSDIAANGLTQSGGSGNDIVIGWAGNDIMYGGDGNDTLDGGAGSNQLFGEGGDDILKVAVSSKNNVLSGGAGNDTLTGGYYNDTYLFNLGDGRDTIYDHDGGYASTDVLRFGEGIASADIQTLKSGTDLVFRHVNGADQITVKNWFSGTTAAAGVAANNIIERVEFADGTAWSWSDIAANGLTQSGGSGNDIVIGWAGNDIMYGGDGNDTLDGGAGSNQLFGEGGDDILKVAVSSKNNVLSGGAGNDTLTGGYYNDTYLFNLGDGRDTIYDHDGGYASTDVLRFGEGIGSNNLWFERNATDLTVSIIGTSDSVIIRNWYSGANYRVEQIQLSNGELLLESQVQGLVDAMASFGSGGEASVADQQPTRQLDILIAAAWQ